MNIRWLITSLIMSFVLIACDESKPNKPPIPHLDKPSGPALFNDQIKALDKAKGVESTLQKQNTEERSTIDKATE